MPEYIVEILVMVTAKNEATARKIGEAGAAKVANKVNVTEANVVDVRELEDE